MSAEFSTLVMFSKEPRDPIERFVLLILSDMTGDEIGTLFPNHEYVARRSGLEVHEVSEVIDRLVEKGFLIPVKLFGKDALRINARRFKS